jgi:hypothetical protein
MNELRLADGTPVGSVVEWSLDPNPMELSSTVGCLVHDGSEWKVEGTFECKITKPDKWVHTKSIWMYGRELSEYDKYCLDMAIHDYRRSLPEYRAHIRAKHRRKIERKQKRAAFRRRKRGLA